MKKVILGLLVFQLFTFAANAQIQKGSILLGGKVNFVHTNTNSDQMKELMPQVTTQEIKSNEFLFNPQIGYTLDNNWVVGTMLTFKTGKSVNDANSSNSTTSSTERITNKSTAFGVGLFARKYFPFSDKFSGFAEVNSGALWNDYNSTYETSTQTPYESETNYTEYQTKLYAGLAYFPKNWMAIELSTNLITFTHSDQEGDITDSNNNSFEFGFNTSAINLGVSFFLNNK